MIWGGFSPRLFAEGTRILIWRGRTEGFAARIGPYLATRPGFADPVTGEGIYYALRSAELFAEAYLAGALRLTSSIGVRTLVRTSRAAQMRRPFYGNFWVRRLPSRMIEFARGHRGVKRVLGDLVAGEQGYVDLKKKLLRSAFRPV